MDTRIAHSIQWCYTRNMTADGHAKGSIQRDFLLEVMAGTQSFKHELKTCPPYRAPTSKVVPGS
eukprot:5466416-Pyramimonas_sp.AAC.1